MQQESFIEGNDTSPSRLRARLEVLFKNLVKIQSVVIVCNQAIEREEGDNSEEIHEVLRTCASDPLRSHLKELTSIVEAMGGTTAYTGSWDANLPFES